MKNDLIKRQDAIDAVKHAWAKGLEPTQYIEELPSAEPERKKGRWIYDTERVMGDGRINRQFHCSVCGDQEFTLYNFCPNCGADMRGE